MKKPARYSKTALRKASALVVPKKKMPLKVVSAEEQNWLLGSAPIPPKSGE